MALVLASVSTLVVAFALTSALTLDVVLVLINAEAFYETFVLAGPSTLMVAFITAF